MINHSVFSSEPISIVVSMYFALQDSHTHIKDSCLLSMASTLTMSSFWKNLLKERYPTFKVEERAFVNSLKVCNSTDVSAEKIYEQIKEDSDVPKNLKALYCECVFGSDKEVKTCIRNRIANIRQSVRFVHISF